ncbi:LacI family DNA-binding transcriptional regulator [Cellulomonas bogoriensis]|uniref:LacI family transcriptional regulator n=1 Tax=Cellulomonas bogoriensis 69B4 = DSM 16987 TaxID=1386082 RepID=A0A0A0BZR4_9CELL|nr:LacI family DNA-binding transcriptional regulator [Cellulomonas bogoriensis]KGM13435.1 LacI family transcriptional regulator [Cellulomonas bogoriensis 69B4 = DSM 16987]
MARVTLQTIADRVGVSRMTVSNAFSRPDQLSSQLRATILATAEELGYVGPDPSARALARGTTGAVGVLLTHSMRTAFRDDIATGFFGAVAHELAPTGLAVTLLPSYGSAEVIPARDVPMDGALVYACPEDAPALGWLVRRRLPLVFVDCQDGRRAASVTLDEDGGAAEAAQHLVDLGHRHVGLLTISFDGPHGVVADPHTAGAGFVPRARAEGWLRVLEGTDVRLTAVQVPDNTESDGYDGARTLLTLPDRPTAILCFSDVMAWSAVCAAGDLGLQVPDEVSVVGFDDSPLARRVRPDLTTVRQDLEAKGKAAARTLTEAIGRHRAGNPEVPEDVVLPTSLVVRGSTAPPPAA